MPNTARHAFGALENIQSALQAGTINAHDVLFVKDANGKPYVGWIDKDGQPVIVNETDEVVRVDTLPAAGEEGKIYIFGEDGYFWDGEKFINLCKPTDVSNLETAISSKADASEVEALEEKINAEFKKNAASQMYEIAQAPEGTLVDYFDKEIRIMIPGGTDFANFKNNIFGMENMRYIEGRVYAPEGAVRHKSNFGGAIEEGTVEAFADCVDEYGRIYIVTTLPVAQYDETSGVWTYFGANSTTKHYIGWNYTIEWFDENDVVIASDSVKINLSNEDCHYAVEPYYVGEMMAEVETKIEEKISEVAGAIEVVEF